MVLKQINKAFSLSESIIINGKNEIFGVLKSIKDRKFEGERGLAIKNGIYQSLTTVVSKVGAFVFTVLLARIMMPELFGLYSLALSTILFFVTISELGITQSFLRFIPYHLGRNNKKEAKSYAIYLAKIKLVILVVMSTLLIISAKFISQNYYNKPIFLALLAGALYIFFVGIAGFSYLFFQSTNNFKSLLKSETLLQIVRIVLIPLVVLYSIKNIASQELNVLWPILILSMLWLLVILFLYYTGKNKIEFMKSKTEELSTQKKKKLNAFILSSSALGLAGLFFGYIDTIILGKFVTSEYIGYYKAAAGLVGTIIPLLVFSNVLLPIFSRLSGKKLESGFSRSLRLTLLLSVILAIIVFFGAHYMVYIIYGSEYLSAVFLLKILSLIIISIPLTSIYVSYLIAQGQPMKITTILVVSTVVSVILNYLFVAIGIRYSESSASIGAAVATVLTTFIYLLGLFMIKKGIKN